MSRLLIIGAGGHGRSVAEIVLMSNEHELVGFLDDASPGLTDVWGRPVLGPIAALQEVRQTAEGIIVAIGNNRLRRQLCEQAEAAGFRLVTVIHPRAIVSVRAAIGPGSAIMAGAVLGTESELGRGVIVNSGAVVDHHCRVDDFGHLGTNASMAGESRLGCCAWMQSGSSLGYRVEVPADAVLLPGEGKTRV
jgi:sugar O-acyltransferase (sialic acid O-acetyltransferase NeuD family)